MSFFSNIGHFFGNLFGGGDNQDEKKKKQQPQQQYTAPQKAPVSYGPSYAAAPQQQQQSQPQANQRPDNGLNLVLPGKTPGTPTGFPTLLQKAQPAPAPTPAPSQPAPKPSGDRRNFGQKVWDQINPLDSDRTFQNYKPEKAKLNESAIHQITHNPVNNTVGSLANNITGSGAIIDAGRLGVAELTHNQPAIDNATVSLAKNTVNFLPIGAANSFKNGFGQDIATAATAPFAERQAKKNADYARRIMNNHTGNPAYDSAVEAYASAVENEGLNQHMATAGFDQNTTSGQLRKKVIGNATNTAANLALFGELPGVNTVPRRILADTGLNAAAGGSEVVANDPNASTGDIIKTAVKSGAIGGVFGAATGLRKAVRGDSPVPKPVETPPTELAPHEVAPGMGSLNPRRAEDAMAQNVSNMPAFQRGFGTEPAPAPTAQELYKADQSALRKADSPQATTFDAGLDPANVSDAVPAFQRRNPGMTVSPENQPRAAELQQMLDTMPNTNDQVRAFELRQRYGQMIAQNPDLAPQLRERLATLMASPDPRAAIQAELDSLQLGLNDQFAFRPQGAARQVEATPVQQTPAAVAGAEPIPAAPVTPETPAAVTPDIQTSAEPVPAPQAPTPQNGSPLPEIPGQGAAEQLPAAPNTYDALVRQIQGGRDLKGKYFMRDKINLDDLRNEASGVVANLSDEQLVSSVASTAPDMLAHDPQSFSVARASLDRLYAMKDNPVAQQQVSNILDAMSRFSSKNAQGLRVVQEEFDNMPLPMKVRYITKKIDQANADTKNYKPLGDDPARASEVEAALTARLQTAQDTNSRIAGLEDAINRIAEAAKNGDVSSKASLSNLTKELTRERTNLQVANGEVAKYFQDLVPGRGTAQKLLVDWPKRLMLSSFTGRINDIVTTGANVADLQGRNFTQGLLAKVVNRVKPGTVTDTWKGTGALIKGSANEVSKFGGELKGKEYVDNLEKSLKGNEDLRSGLRKAKGPVGRTIQAGTELATKFSSGVKDQRLYQLADQEAAQAGLTGEARRVYSEARAAAPTRQMVAKAEQLKLEMNNLNDNPISRTLNRVSQAMEGDNAFAKTGIGGLIKNQVLPFTSWLGGNIWNSVTDKNVLAQFAKLTVDLGRRDAEGAIQHLAGTINGAAQAYAIGYLLAQNNVLTQKNAEGYNDGGMYFHVGDRYIPVGILGFVAPNIVLGKMAYDGLNSDRPLYQMGSDIGNFAWHGLALGQAVGVENTLTRAYNTATQPGHGFYDGAAQFGAGAAGQYIPALGSDVNAVLNNSPMNPTHEAADTRVQSTGTTPTGRPSKAKDVPASSLRSLENRVPILSQELPRKPGVAAPDLIDRTTRGDRQTGAQKQAVADAQTEATKLADLKKRDVPYFKDKGYADAVQARIERGEWDKATEAMKLQLDSQKNDNNVPQSSKDKLQHKITQMEIAQQQKLSYSDMKLYNSTSLTEWRNMGDSTKDGYDKATYDKLWSIDQALADNGVAGGFAVVSGNSSSLSDKQKYSEKSKKSGSGSGGGRGGGSAASREATTIRSNKVGSTPELAKISLGNLAPQKAGSVAIPTIKQIQSSDLVKKRKISVGKA